MQAAFEKLDHFPSFAQILEINSSLKESNGIKIGWLSCNECDGYGITIMTGAIDNRTSAFACSSCHNGTKQFQNAKGKSHGESKIPFELPFSAKGRTHGYEQAFGSKKT